MIMSKHIIVYLYLMVQLGLMDTGQEHLVIGERSCRLGTSTEAAWRHCLCVPVGAETSLHIMCHQMSSATVPPLSKGEKEEKMPFDVVALSMTDGALAYLQQDAFKNQNMQTLDFSNNQIQTVNVNAFRGLEMKLTLLNLRHNNLSVIPAWALTYLHQLQFLHLENNRITHVRPNTFDETQLNNLQFLHLDHNKLKSIPNLSLRRLRLIVLTLSNNRIADMEKMSIPATLSFLDLRNNILTQIPYMALQDLTELQTLNLEGNNITQLDHHSDINFKQEMTLILRNNKIRRLDQKSFKSFKRLKELDLSFNQITRVFQDAFETISSIKTLDLSYNSIAYIPHGTFKNLAKNLDRLNLEENMIHTLPDAFRDLHSLSVLNLNGNKLTDLNNDVMVGIKRTLTEFLLAYNQLKEVPTTVLTGMEKLQHLDLSKNKISQLEKLAFGTFDGTGTSLVILNLAGNHIRNISDPGAFLYMSNLAYLDLSYNQIDHLGPKTFEKLPGLEKLFLQNNRLKAFPLSALYNMQKLRHLVLDNNGIRTLPSYLLGDLLKLEHISLANNLISRIDEKTFHASSTRELRTLNLGGNRIEHISSEAFSHLDSLQHLRLANNRIQTLPSSCFLRLKNLRHLDLSENRLIRLAQRTFHNLPSLEIVKLHHNALEEMEKNTFHGITRMDHLLLNNNKLKTVDCDFLGTVGSISNVDLSHNKISKIDLSCVKRSLHSLHLSHNGIQTVSKETMENFEQLEELSLSHNGILEIQANALQTCRKLSIIDLSHNHLRNIWKNTFTHQEMITKLDLSHNALIGIQRGSLGKQNLLSINLAYNALTRVPIEALETCSSSISALNMMGNQFKIIDSPQLVNLKNVSSLVLSMNKIDSVEEAAFEHLTSLRHLDLSHNPITSWDPAAFKDISHSIYSLNLADTGLFSLPKLNHRSIRHMNISWNKIYELSSKELVPFSKMVLLDISHNNLKHIDPHAFEDLGDLKHLNISSNPITLLTEEHFKHMYQVETLFMTDMSELQRLPEARAFSHLTNLKHFRITGLPPDSSPYNLTDISANLAPLISLHVEITEQELHSQLHPLDKRLLRELHITGKNMSKINIGALHSLRGYRFQLTISDTAIDEFPWGLFNTMTSINYLVLSLANNRIQTITPFKHSSIPAINQHGTILSSIQLENNPILCNCAMSWMSEWLEHRPAASEELSSIECQDRRSQRLVVFFSDYAQHIKCLNHGSISSSLFSVSSCQLVCTAFFWLMATWVFV